MSAEREPNPDRKDHRRAFAPSSTDGMEFGVSEPCGVRLPQFDGWPELGEPPVLIEPYGVRVYRLDNTQSGPTLKGRPISRMWVYDVSGVTQEFEFKEIDRLVPAATRAARAARAAAESPTGPGTAPSPAG